MKDQYNLKRFVAAQELDYKNALEEVGNGKKTSHWMWYVFPQIEGLGLSSTAQKYAIRNAAEAKAYLNHEILGPRLLEITNTLLNINNRSAHTIFGSPDYLKLKSSMTLFSMYSDENNVFTEILVKYFKNERCAKTIELLKN